MSSLVTNAGNHSDSPSALVSTKHRPDVSILSRALSLSAYFLSGALSINLTQILGVPLSWVDEDWYDAWIAYTKQSFGILTTYLTHAFAPTTVVVSGDVSVRGQVHQSADGTLKLKFPNRMILIANHQIYTDWLYLWWMAYCNGTHGRLYIILKESLKRIPVVGWGMQLSQFIFVRRDWVTDRPRLVQALSKLNQTRKPMWLLLFPEGTNLAPCTRAKSAQWAAKTGVQDMRHVLLPRCTGLQFCLSEMKGSVEYLYDCTIAYEGVRRGQYAQDIFTLKAAYLHGKPPKSVSMYWRRFRIKDIPVHSSVAFQSWLNARWLEKDLLIENYLRFGRFPADAGATRISEKILLKGSGRLCVQIKPSQWYEFLQIFAPMGTLAMVLYIIYGPLPRQVWNSISKDTMQTATGDLDRVMRSAQDAPYWLNSDAFFDKSKQEKTFQNLGGDLVRLLQSPGATSVISRAGLVQRWLEDPQKFIVENLKHLSNERPQLNFYQELRMEAGKRRRPNRQGTFWKDLEAVEASRSNKPSKDSTAAPSCHVSKREVSRLEPLAKKLGPSKTQANSFRNDLRAEKSIRSSAVAASTSRQVPTRTVQNKSPTVTGKSMSRSQPHGVALRKLPLAHGSSNSIGSSTKSSAMSKPEL